MIMGGSLEMTEFLCMSYDTVNSKIILGGYSKSTDVISNNQSAILVSIDATTGSLIWNKQIDCNYLIFNH